MKKVGLALAYLYRRFHEEGYAYHVTALVYTTLHSLVPLAIVVFTLLSFVPAFQKVGIRIQDVILENFIPTSADKICFLNI
ncbi:hypothetical protein [Candidatus Coxiella mudrowiae]|uniref:hypothetical protein n=1 Tax=Candidatus Coxiella mudrowiae TaxID=2054173 RepID=UPI001FD35BFF|nr:hypothetical protein [Candidatus Coxiella mudrowiae]